MAQDHKGQPGKLKSTIPPAPRLPAFDSYLAPRRNAGGDEPSSSDLIGRVAVTALLVVSAGVLVYYILQLL